ncbi:MAG: glycosyltransferase family 2 protein [Acidobacteria bacterium]|nr:glycosyltransferase family 2 protein [Acidobacteriota bacterium]
MPPPRISAVIITRNNRLDIGDALRSLRESQPRPDEVIVIDQSSSDGTADLVRRDFPEALVLDFWDNPGFGEGNNRGFRVATGEYLFLLNPDAVAERCCLAGLLGALQADRGRGIAVPKTVMAGEPSVINSAGLLMNRIGHGWDRGFLEWDHGQFDRSEDVLAGSGCALLIRASVVRALGGFDAPYFLYYEDLDLCLRSWLAGHAVHYVPSAVVRHNMKVHARPLLYGEYLDHRNRLRTLAKVLSGRSLIRLAPTVLQLEARAILALVARRQWQAARFRAAAAAWNLVHAGSTVRLRRAVQRSRTVGDDQLRRLMALGGDVPRARAAIPGYPPVYQHSLDLSQLAATLEMGRNDIGALGLGWHGLESMDGRACRWSCGYGILFLRAPRQAWSGKITLTCRSPRPVEVGVRVSGQPPAPLSLTGAGWEDHVLDAATTDGLLRLEILPQRTLTPAEEMPGTPDSRVLGVAVASATAG